MTTPPFMPASLRAKRFREAGTSLIATAAFITILSAAVGVAFLGTVNIGRDAQRTKLRQGGIAVGDAYLEWAFAQWRATCRTQNNTALSGSYFSPLSVPSATYLPQPTGFTVSNFAVVATDVEGTVQATGTAPPPAQGEDTGDNTYYYKASADVSVPSLNASKPVVAKVRRIFEKHVESPWRYAIFYESELEMHPSPTFTVSGWVHSNGDLFVSPDGGNPLNFTDRVTFADTYFQGYDPDDYVWRGRSSADGAAPTYAAGLTPTQETRHDFFGITPDQFSTTDANTNNDGYRELIERPTSGTDPLTDSNGNNPRFYNTAGVKVLVDASNNVTVMKADGTVVTATTGSVSDKAIYNAVAPAISTNQSIQDNREAASVRLVTVDVSKLSTATIAGWNGVVYVSDTSASQTGGSPKRGVRIKNGATLPTGGLTLVSDNPVYIQGDYNTSATRKPAAVIGDAVMFLSNNWNDANSSADINSGSRNATNTTINTAILAGNVPTDDSYSGNAAYSGGVENFPRFMENWGGVTITYNGSMVQLFQSKQAIGRWGNGQAYGAPIRNWAFDPLFRTSPPPGTLFTTTYVKQRWYLE